MPDYPLTQKYPVKFEDLFTVVWWDQRGAALSFSSNISQAEPRWLTYADGPFPNRGIRPGVLGRKNHQFAQPPAV